MSLVGLDWGTNLRPYLTWDEYAGHYTTGEVSPPFTATSWNCTIRYN